MAYVRRNRKHVAPEKAERYQKAPAVSWPVCIAAILESGQEIEGAVDVSNKGMSALQQKSGVVRRVCSAANFEPVEEVEEVVDVPGEEPNAPTAVSAVS